MSVESTKLNQKNGTASAKGQIHPVFLLLDADDRSRKAGLSGFVDAKNNASGLKISDQGLSMKLSLKRASIDPSTQSTKEFWVARIGI